MVANSPNQSCQPTPGRRLTLCPLPVARRGCTLRWAESPKALIA